MRGEEAAFYLEALLIPGHINKQQLVDLNQTNDTSTNSYKVVATLLQIKAILHKFCYSLFCWSMILRKEFSAVQTGLPFHFTTESTYKMRLRVDRPL